MLSNPPVYRYQQSWIIQQLLTFCDIDRKKNDSHVWTEAEWEAFCGNKLQGCCVGFAIVYSYMAAVQKNLSWQHHLDIISRWDGQEKSLEQNYELWASDRGFTSLHDLLRRASDYVFYTQNFAKFLQISANQYEILTDNNLPLEGDKPLIHCLKLTTSLQQLLESFARHNPSTQNLILYFVNEEIRHAYSLRIGQPNADLYAYYFYDANNQAFEIPFENATSFIEYMSKSHRGYFDFYIATWDEQIKINLLNIESEILGLKFLNSNRLDLSISPDSSIFERLLELASINPTIDFALNNALYYHYYYQSWNLVSALIDAGCEQTLIQFFNYSEHSVNAQKVIEQGLLQINHQGERGLIKALNFKWLLPRLYSFMTAYATYLTDIYVSHLSQVDITQKNQLYYIILDDKHWAHLYFWLRRVRCPLMSLRKIQTILLGTTGIPANFYSRVLLLHQVIREKYEKLYVLLTTQRIFEFHAILECRDYLLETLRFARNAPELRINYDKQFLNYETSLFLTIQQAFSNPNLMSLLCDKLAEKNQIFSSGLSELILYSQTNQKHLNAGLQESLVLLFQSPNPLLQATIIGLLRQANLYGWTGMHHIARYSPLLLIEIIELAKIHEPWRKLLRDGLLIKTNQNITVLQLIKQHQPLQLYHLSKLADEEINKILQADVIAPRPKPQYSPSLFNQAQVCQHPLHITTMLTTDDIRNTLMQNFKAFS
ncbi:MAG: hypothetical protein KIT27_01695 [Legionellales bacterium]|nr:hypothetical protein [Legionellales bacterium]